MTQIVPNIEAVVDPQTVKNIENLLDGLSKDFKFTLPGALTDVAKSARTEIKKRISKKITLKSGSILKAMKITRGTSLRNPSRTITIRGFRSNLKHFGRASQKKKGVSYRISKDDSRKTVLGAFLVEKFSDNVFIRRGKSSLTDKRRVGRLPIDKLRGPSVPAIYQNRNDTIPNDVLGDISQQLLKRVQARIELKQRQLVAKAAKGK